MKIEVFADADAVARHAAEFIAGAARAAVGARGIFTLAVSGGRTPWQMLRALADLDVPWDRVQLFQVDERVAQSGDPERNFTHITESLLNFVPLPAGQVHAMAVDDPDLPAAAARYAQLLESVAGTPPVLDLVHLGLGTDGHTASLVPDDPVLMLMDAEVGVAGPYQGHRRLTLTYPVLDRARQILFVVTGAEKIEMLRQLCADNQSIPAGRVSQTRALVMADRAAAGARAAS